MVTNPPSNAGVRVPSLVRELRSHMPGEEGQLSLCTTITELSCRNEYLAQSKKKKKKSRQEKGKG